MIISELNHLEVVGEAASVAGAYGYGYVQRDYVELKFKTTNDFETVLDTDLWFNHNTSAAGAKSEAKNRTYWATDSYNKADTIAYTDFMGGGFAASSSAAGIKPKGY